MFSKKLLWALAFIFIFLSVMALLTNMPQKKEKRVYNQILETFPYEIQKEFGGLDIVDKRTGKDLDVPNAKVYLIFDELMKKWGKTHIRLAGDTVEVLDDQNRTVKKIKLKNRAEEKYIKEFFDIK